MKRFIKEYLNFTRSEKRAYLFIVGLIVVMITLKQFLYLFKKEEVTDFTEFKKEIELFENQVEKVVEQKKVEYASTQFKYNSKPSYKKSKAEFNKVKELIEINEADSIQLKELYGIGNVLSKRIVNYRDLLGGFVSVSQLKEVYGLSDDTYNSITPRITIDSSKVSFININVCEIDKLKKHPYISYKMARTIIEARKITNEFNQTIELLENNIIDSVSYYRIAPYLVID